jgi:hypothetical protein
MTRLVALSASLILLLSASPAWASTCDYIHNTVDVFDKERRTMTSWLRLHGVVDDLQKELAGPGQIIEVAGVRRGAQQFLAVKLRLRSAVAAEPSVRQLKDLFIVNAGGTLAIRLADSSVINLAAAREFHGKSMASTEDRRSIGTDAQVLYALDATALSALEQNPATAVLIETTANKYRLRVAADSGGSIAQVIGCISPDHGNGSS